MPKHTLLFGCLLLLLLPAAGISQSPMLTRGDAARILLLNRTDNIPLFPNVNRFPDVPKGHPLERYLLAAERYGVLTADPATQLLRPDDMVTRAAFLKMLTLTFGLSTGLPENYKDVSKEDWFWPYAGLAQNYNLFPGSGTQLKPTQSITQDDAVFAISKLQEALQHAQDDQKVAKDQSNKQLEIYVVISSKRLHTVFQDEQDNALPQLTTTSDAKLEDLRQEVLNLVNGKRAKAGAPPLRLNTLLNGSAQTYAHVMADEGFFSHVSPEGQTLRDRITGSGYYDRTYQQDCHCIPGYTLGENLARGQRTPKEAVDAWMKSQSHRDALLDPAYTDTGIGIEAGLWVEHFGGVLEPK